MSISMHGPRLRAAAPQSGTSASLIAAAPMMLETLQWIVTAEARIQDNPSPVEAMRAAIKLISEIRAEALAAVVKARGES